MRVRELKLGKSIEIYVVRDEYKLRLISKIEDVQMDHIAITLIEGNGKVFQFKPTDTIEFIYKDEERLYKFKQVSGTTGMIEEERVHILECPVDGESFNRRQAYRIFLGEENEFAWTSNGHEHLLHDFIDKMNEAEDEHLKKGCHCIIKDLSERGAGLCTNEGLKLGDYVSFELATSMGAIRCIGQVVRQTRERNGLFTNVYGVEFSEVSNIITKYVFAVQRLQLKNKKR